ncbi:hypothetical protein EDB92DRAFT_1955157 [Lactarius akahatsu]|uniref:Uncharacterized protein n=1 Tax=Lactarius akahatsu TaxID=416441 RepID=A0AAD4L446_9AGAM|nr:hypothetical protein EDB92DRAFT_1955157 [Lactarius akahatsu]
MALRILFAQFANDGFSRVQFILELPPFFICSLLFLEASTPSQAQVALTTSPTFHKPLGHERVRHDGPGPEVAASLSGDSGGFNISVIVDVDVTIAFSAAFFVNFMVCGARPAAESPTSPSLRSRTMIINNAARAFSLAAPSCAAAPVRTAAEAISLLDEHLFSTSASLGFYNP